MAAPGHIPEHWLRLMRLSILAGSMRKGMFVQKEGSRSLGAEDPRLVSGIEKEGRSNANGSQEGRKSPRTITSGLLSKSIGAGQ